MEGEPGAVLVDVPLAGRAGDDLPLVVDAAQPLEDGADDLEGGLARGGLGVKGVHVLGQGVCELHAGLIAAGAGAETGKE